MDASDGNPRRRRWLWGVLVAALAGVAVAAVWSGRRAPAPTAGTLPVYGTVPDLAFVDQQGQHVSLAQWHGAPWVADFIFTRCAGQCPLMTARMRALQARLPAGSPVQLVSFSVDSAYDTPPVLAAYAAQAGATARWRFLTGSQETVFRLSRNAFHLAADTEGGSPEEPIIHSVRLVLVDGQGRIRGYYDGTDPATVERLLADLATLR